MQNVSDATLKSWENNVTRAVADPELLKNPELHQTITEVLRALERGQLRVATPAGLQPSCGEVDMSGDLREWTVHAWVKQTILLAMRWRVPQAMGLMASTPTFGSAGTVGEWGDDSQTQGRVHARSLQFFDKFDARSDMAAAGVRVVPPGVVREGAFVAPGCIVMPGFVNIGAWVGRGSMVDTWATVGSCAQVGKNVHLAGGVGIGGVLEPAGARPVMIGDEAFVGSRAIIVEGAVVGCRAVLGANVCITASTPIIDVTTDARTEHRGFVPPGAVVAPGTRPKLFPGGEVQLQCAYIIAYRSDKTDAKVSLNAVLRETGITV